MSHILLLGAGFSRNWGGWLADEAFEYLLGHPLIINNQRLKQLLWKHKDIGGFEYTLAEIQAEHNRGADQQNNLKQLQDAVVQMFADMNKSFLRVNDFDKSLQDFLTKFDAIFTLNQDLLMEGHYHCGNIVQQAASGKTATLILTSTKKWQYWHMPGITNPEVKASVPHKRQYHEGNWFPTDAADFKLDEHKQPYFKLHGSCNWRDQAGGQLLVMGGNKDATIRSHEILKWYHAQFEQRLSMSGTKLMIIGYSFRDTHINAALNQAAQKGGLQVFVIDPKGVDAIGQHNLTRRPGNIYCANDVESALHPTLIGASRRSLQDIFTSDQAEHAKVMRFFG